MKKINKQTIFSILGLLVILGSIPLAVLMVKQRQEIRKEAADAPSKYRYNCENGKCIQNDYGKFASLNLCQLQCEASQKTETSSSQSISGPYPIDYTTKTTPTPTPYCYNKTTCTNRKGTCGTPSSCNSKAGYHIETGLCPGGDDCVCCVPNSSQPTPTKTTDVVTDGNAAGHPIWGLYKTGRSCQTTTTKEPTPTPKTKTQPTPTNTPIVYQPTPTPTAIPTLTPTPIPTVTVGCNQSCTSNDNCNSGLICSSGYCRNTNCPGETDCHCPGPTATPIPTSTPTPGPTATPIPTSTPTPGPTATPTVIVSCNQSCTSNDNCNSGLICSSGYCRNTNCPGETDCHCPGPTATSTPVPGESTIVSQATPTPVIELPVAGFTLPTFGAILGGILFVILASLLFLL